MTQADAHRGNVKIFVFAIVLRCLLQLISSESLRQNEYLHSHIAFMKPVGGVGYVASQLPYSTTAVVHVPGMDRAVWREILLSQMGIQPRCARTLWKTTGRGIFGAVNSTDVR